MPEYKFVKIFRSPNPEKKWRVRLVDTEGKFHHVDFGARGYEDFTMHHDEQRKRLYLMRHAGMGEDWKKSGLLTPGFWSRHALWNRSSVADSIADIRSRFGI